MVCVYFKRGNKLFSYKTEFENEFIDLKDILLLSGDQHPQLELVKRVATGNQNFLTTRWFYIHFDSFCSAKE